MKIRTAKFDDDYEALRAVRFAVFVDEQNVPVQIEMDDRDPVCEHVLAVSDDGSPIGTGRIDLGDSGRIGRVAVIAAHRRGGVGSALMRALHSLALENSLDSVWCHAQLSAVPFYEHLGYEVGDEATFIEAGIEHVLMHKSLAGEFRS